jgi:hypothetical protein
MAVVPLSDATDADPAFLVPLPGRDLQRAPDGEYRTVRFRTHAVADLVGPGGRPLGLFLIQGGAELRAQVRPACGAQAAADLLFEDGTTARRVPRAAFTSDGQTP